MGERVFSRTGIAALGSRFHRASYASEVFFTLAMHMRLLTNFLLRHFHLLLRPPLHRLTPQKPHLLDDPLFGRIGLLEISLGILYRADNRRDSFPKTGASLDNCQKRFVTKFRRRHC